MSACDYHHCRPLHFRLCSSLVSVCMLVHKKSLVRLQMSCLPAFITFDEEVPQQLPTLLSAVALQGRASSDRPTFLMLFWRRAKLPSSVYTHPAICSINLFLDAWVKAQWNAKAELSERQCSGTIRLLSVKTGGFRDGQCALVTSCRTAVWIPLFHVKEKVTFGPRIWPVILSYNSRYWLPEFISQCNASPSPTYPFPIIYGTIFFGMKNYMKFPSLPCIT